MKEKKMIPQEEFKYVLELRHTKEVQDKISAATVGVAGLGGLGSNIAISLARLGVGHLILVDFDIVELVNLNRQQYYIHQIGIKKAEAIQKILHEINPYLDVEAYAVKVTPENIQDLFGTCDILCEAFDKPDQKAMLANCVLERLPNIPLVCGSGLAGYENANQIVTRKKMKNLYICGDEVHAGAEGNGLMAPRVSICAGHQSNLVLQLILDKVDC